MKKSKKLAAAALTMALALSNVTASFACTGIYVGSQVSESGSTFIGRSEDIGDQYGKLFDVAPAKDWPAGAIYEDAYGFSMPYPSHTYGYTYVRDSYAYGECVQDENGNDIGEPYAAAGTNEKGVSITATVSTHYNEQAEAADPLVDTGICEISMTSILLGGAATAKEGVELLADIIDTYGAGECNALVISDTNEVWYFEVVSGHQYAAVKLPDDKAAVNPNIMLLGEIDLEDTENVVVSKDLVKVAQEGGFYQTGENGKFHVAKSYAVSDSKPGQYSRYYQGLYYLDPAQAAKMDVNNINNNVNPLSLLVDPAKKLSTMEALQFLGYRGEGSAMNSNEDPDIYPIGNNRQAECHVFELRKGMPAQLASIEWLSMGDADFSVFVPFYGALLTATNEHYHQEGDAYVENSINWNFQIINAICAEDRDHCGAKVKEYFAQYQQSILDQQAEVDAQMQKIFAQDPELAKEKATALADNLAQQVYEMSTSVLAELQSYVEAGNFEEVFVPTAMTDGVMPKYNFDQVGGTGLEEGFNWTVAAVAGVVVVVAAAGGYVLYKKKK